MMRSKLLIILSLLLGLEGLALAGIAHSSKTSAAFSPDGVAVIKTQRRRRKRRRRYKAQRPTSYPVLMPDTGAAPPEASPAPPPPPPAPAQEEMPVMSAPPSSDPMDNPGQGRPAKRAGGPRIKPPTVSIKPPTE